jgi:hypothetical protein
VELTDGGHDGQSHGGVHAGDGHEPADLGSMQAHPPQLGIHQAELLSVEVQLPEVTSTACRSSDGRSCPASYARPLRPNRSAAGHRGRRLRWRMAWTWFFSLVRWRTMWARRATWRRRAWVPLSGIHTNGR